MLKVFYIKKYLAQHPLPGSTPGCEVAGPPAAGIFPGMARGFFHRQFPSTLMFSALHKYIVNLYSESRQVKDYKYTKFGIGNVIEESLRLRPLEC